MEVKLKELIIDGKVYNSRLIIGTGKYRDFQQTKEALVASGAEMITVAGEGKLGANKG